MDKMDGVRPPGDSVLKEDNVADTWTFLPAI